MIRAWCLSILMEKVSKPVSNSESTENWEHQGIYWVGRFSIKMLFSCVMGLCCCLCCLSHDHSLLNLSFATSQIPSTCTSQLQEWSFLCKVILELVVPVSENPLFANFIFMWVQKVGKLLWQIASSIILSLVQQRSSLQSMTKSLVCDMHINHRGSMKHLNAWENPLYLLQHLSICLTLKWKCCRALRHMV